MTAAATRRQVPEAFFLGGAALLLAVQIWFLHGGAADTGLFLDDYAHYTQLQEAGWSISELAAACRLELVGGAVDMWWLPETTLRFFRPLAFGLMKAVYVASDWSPYAQHVASLAWHLVVCVLGLVLLRRLGLRKRYALLVMLTFAVHPGHIATVQWIACQTELIVTAFLLAATLCFAEYRHWQRDRVAQPMGHLGWLVGALVFFVLALGCRENAIMFPAVMFVADRAARRPLLKWREWPAYGWMALIAVGYLLLRQSYLDGVALPPRPYIFPPGEPGFLRFIFDKLLYYLLGELAFIPVIPIGGIPFLRENALWFYFGAAAVIALLAWVVWQRRRDAIGLLGPAWLVLYLFPLLPAFASPHHLYLPGIGWAMIFGSVLTAVHGEVAPERPWRRRVALVMGAGLAGLFMPLTWLLSVYAIRPAQAVEDQVFAEIAHAPVPVQDGDTVYFGNFPLIAHYGNLLIEERLGLENVTVKPLMWAPRLLGPTTPTEIERVDERTLEVAVGGDRFFADPLGRLVAEAQGQPLREMLAEPYETEDFTVHLLAADERGLQRLRFVFHEPLNRPGVHVFWGSEILWAFQYLPEDDANER